MGGLTSIILRIFDDLKWKSHSSQTDHKGSSQKTILTQTTKTSKSVKTSAFNTKKKTQYVIKNLLKNIFKTKDPKQAHLSHQKQLII